LKNQVSMSAPIELQNLIADVAHSYPAAAIEFDPLPSGVCFLWVTVTDRNFVIEYDPKRGTGVSENLPDTPPFVGHDEGFDSLTPAIDRFKSMLAEAARNEPASAYVSHDKKH
jgi:hypothetical protein